jgi:hypothetical protein
MNGFQNRLKNLSWIFSKKLIIDGLPVRNEHNFVISNEHKIVLSHYRKVVRLDKFNLSIILIIFNRLIRCKHVKACMFFECKATAALMRLFDRVGREIILTPNGSRLSRQTLIQFVGGYISIVIIS